MPCFIYHYLPQVFGTLRARRTCQRLLLLLISLSALVPVGRAQSGYRRLEDGRLLPPHVNTTLLIHVDFDTTIHVGSVLTKDQRIGQVDEQPLVRSSRYGMALLASEDDYAAGRYVAGAVRLAEAARLEPANPFITYQRARCLYRDNATKPQAYALYRRLVQQLDAAVPDRDSVLVADIWFPEAYWKLGTLHMDNGHWSEAIYSMAQFLAAVQPGGYVGTPLHEQLLGYLTECFYQVHDAPLCHFYATETLRLFPGNDYVQPYLAALNKMKGATKKPARNTPGRLALPRGR